MPIPLLPLALLSGGLLPLIGAYPIAAWQGASQPAADIEVVNGTHDRNQRLTVPVSIGQKGPYDFIIDTGAERTVLSRTLATNLGLAATSRGVLMGVAGSLPVDLVDVEEINLGRRSYYGLIAPLLDAQFIGADGIIGLDSLQDQRVLIDFDHNRMAIGDAKSLGGNGGFEIVVRARRKSGQLIMTDALVDGIRTDIVIDTGAETTIANRALQVALSKRRKTEQTQLMSVTGQSITADIGYARRIDFGGITLANTELAFADAPPFESLQLSARPAILLGMTQLRLFHRVAIDFATRKVLFDLPDGIMPMPGAISVSPGR
ncbi:retroviral-like aspartic protease family protein [Novosphingobium lentum]|uniref:retroviral-like aspartic protease family protein n=1 Tax=Novosphingobium lentum TaxID=145287 RepID=UPI000830B481|nr:retroviral-like aspartic protease family protein [Novosphingobium lentum]